MLSPEFLHSVLECEPEHALVIVSESGTILFANQPMSDLSGYTLGELHGKPVELLMPKRLRLPHVGHRLRFTDDPRTRPMGNGHALFVCCKDGSERSVEIGLCPLRRGLEMLLVAVIRESAEQSSMSAAPDAHRRKTTGDS